MKKKKELWVINGTEAFFEKCIWNNSLSNFSASPLRINPCEVLQWTLLPPSTFDFVLCRNFFLGFLQIYRKRRILE